MGGEEAFLCFCYGDREVDSMERHFHQLFKGRGIPRPVQLGSCPSRRIAHVLLTHACFCFLILQLHIPILFPRLYFRPLCIWDRILSSYPSYSKDLQVQSIYVLVLSTVLGTQMLKQYFQIEKIIIVYYPQEESGKSSAQSHTVFFTVWIGTGSKSLTRVYVEKRSLDVL